MRTSPLRSQLTAVVATGAAIAVLVTGCASSTPSSTSSTSAPASAAPLPTPGTTAESAAPSARNTKTTYPVTIEDCGGRQTTYEKAPERVVTLDPAVTESLLLLGLKDRIVGFTEFQTPDQRWAQTKADMDSLNVINRDMNYPSKEAVVAQSPDLVTSIYPSALVSNDTLPNRDAWAGLGVNTYLMGGECNTATAPVTDFSRLYTDLRNFGVMFDVQDRAEAEIAEMEARVAALQERAGDGKPLTVWTYSGEKDPFPSGAGGSANAVITMAGLTNAFSDIPDGYGEVSWEEVVQRDPDVVWVMTAAGSGFVDVVAGIKDVLAQDSRLANVAAVKNGAYVVISYNEGGVVTPRNVDALELMIDGIASLS